MKSTEVAAIVSILYAFTAHAAVIDTQINPANGHTYYLLASSTWTEAQIEAVSLGGLLATVNDNPEQTWIFSTFTGSGTIDRGLWIGYFDLNQTTNSTDRSTRRTEFGWVSDESTSFSNWGPVEPNNPVSGDPNPPEFYVHMWNPTDPNAGTWNNYVDQATIFSRPIHGVVEVVPEPSSMIFCLFGASFCLVRRSRGTNKRAA